MIGDRRIGPYELLGLIGAGGMGEVYLARDTKLGRDVAIKVLPPDVAHDADRIRRFEREARTLASLNHPHIAHVYGVEDAGGTGALVMEYVDGPTLADRLSSGPLPLEEALPMARQMAEALEYAHDRGIVHRDFKPSNVKLGPDGNVKVLDFGLAKALGTETPPPREASEYSDAPTGLSVGPPEVQPGSDSGTTDADMTKFGTVLGTTSYMPPEQARGRQVDRRADIWAFGCVLFEMLTARRAFIGPHASDALSGALSTTSTSPPAGIPAPLWLLLRRCLERDPRRRLRDIGEARVVLEDLIAIQGREGDQDAHTPGEPGVTATTPPTHTRTRWIPWAVATLAAVAAIASVVARLWAPSPPPPLTADISAPSGLEYRLLGDLAAPPVLTPAGDSLIFGAMGEGQTRLHVRSLATGETRRIEGTEGATFPFVSPDGQAVAFFAEGKLKRADLRGGSVLTICDAANGRGGAWGPDGTIVFSPDFRTALVKVRSIGGTPEPVTKLDATRHSTHRWPSLTADGRHVVYFAATHVFQEGEANELRLASLDGGNDRPLTLASGSAVVVGSTVLFPRETTLVMQVLDTARGVLTGDPQTVVSGVLVEASTWQSVFSASENRLVVAPAALGGGGHLVRMDRAGRTIGEIASTAPFRDIRLSPDGRRLVASRGAPGDLWIFDLERGSSSRFTVDPTNEQGALWSSDGRWICYVTTRSDDRKDRFYRKPADGTGAAELLYETADRRDVEPTDISADGRRLLVRVGTSPFVSDSAVYELSLDANRTLTPVLTGPFVVRDGTYSPDGRWIAYTSFESGAAQVYVVSAPGATVRPGKWPVSVDGGTAPLWSADGRELYFLDSASVLRASSVVSDGRDGLKFGTPSALFATSFAEEGRSVAVAPDGRSFVVNHRGDPRSQPLRLIQPWRR